MTSDDFFLVSADNSVMLASRCSKDLLSSHLVPMMEEMKDRAIKIWDEENNVYSFWNIDFQHYGAQYEVQERLIEVMQDEEHVPILAKLVKVFWLSLSIANLIAIYMYIMCILYIYIHEQKCFIYNTNAYIGLIC